MICQASVLGFGDKVINNTNKDLCPKAVYILFEGIDKKQDEKTYSVSYMC